MIMSMILISMSSMCWWRNHIIMMLLSLEMLLITIFLLMSNLMTISFSFTMLIFLTTMVCASSFGLSVLVAISRNHKSTITSPTTSMIYNNNTISNKNNISI
uniref:NADH-ubiquinone oxidoreductase chain 4L n=1 Tax=Harpactocrates apennicola TaxID=1110479 RepID=A0A516IMC8_9ARAC|nr:NADH dehydrogenase subunit 4L [Harpactocrates apennicola]QDP17926.1 NADH dehydrogenase subunit 4L [Harpactocrates apennicola]